PAQQLRDREFPDPDDWRAPRPPHYNRFSTPPAFAPPAGPAGREGLLNEGVREVLLETPAKLPHPDPAPLTPAHDPREGEPLGRVFRTLHTVKGTAGFLGLPKLQAVAHAAENLLSSLRDGELLFDPEIAGALLGVVDAVREVLVSIEQSQQEGDGEY